MNRLLYIAIVTLLSFHAYGINKWYDAPLRLPTGSFTIDSIADNPAKAKIHVRARGTGWGIKWAETSADDYMECRLDITPTDDRIYTSPCVLKVVRMSHGTEAVVYEADISSRVDIDAAGYNSIKISFDGLQCRLYVGGDEQSLITSISDGMHGGSVSVVANKPIDCKGMEVFSVSLPAVPMARILDDECMAEYVALSTDPKEGKWIYLDRDIKSEYSSIGGRYTLATIDNGSGYDIVYLSGADENAVSWLPYMLKGRLIPTVYKDLYNLEWYDSGGRLLSEDNFARYSDDFGTLTLNFPILNAVIRFSRTR